MEAKKGREAAVEEGRVRVHKHTGIRTGTDTHKRHTHTNRHTHTQTNTQAQAHTNTHNHTNTHTHTHRVAGKQTRESFQIQGQGSELRRAKGAWVERVGGGDMPEPSPDEGRDKEAGEEDALSLE